MVLFVLTFPHIASWNGKWNGENKLYARLKYDHEVPKKTLEQIL